MILLGIAGGTASGKTTIARELQSALGADKAAILSHDRYYHSVPQHRRAELDSYNFDEPAALDTALLVEHLRALKQGQSVGVPTYDFSTHSRMGEEAFHPKPVVIVEGILIFCELQLVEELHRRVFVRAPSDVRLARRILRDTTDRGRRVDDVVRQYFGTVKPMHDRYVEPSSALADLQLDGTQDLPASVTRLLAEIHPLLR